jgi:hypothetical protein
MLEGAIRGLDGARQLLAESTGQILYSSDMSNTGKSSCTCKFNNLVKLFLVQVCGAFNGLEEI